MIGSHGRILGFQVRQKVAQMNEGLGYLLRKMEAAHLLASTNLIVLSDHGRAPVERERVIDIHKYLANRTDLYRRVLNIEGPIIDFIVQPGKADELFRYLQDLIEKDLIRNTTVYRKGRMPERCHYQNHPRSPEMLLAAQDGFYLWAVSCFDDVEFSRTPSWKFVKT